MTETPYGWIDELERAASNLERAATRAAKDALRARLTAGDAAIKRVAELTPFIELAHRFQVEASDLRIGKDKAEADLAATRAEIERLQNAIDTRFQPTVNEYAKQAEGWADKYHALFERVQAALAPKEPT